LSDTIVTSFGGVDFTKDRAYAIMSWYLCSTISIHDKENLAVVVGSPKGICLNMAKEIGKDFSICRAVEAPAKPDKFCSKIHAMKGALEKSSPGDIICYLDADVLTYAPVSESINRFRDSNKMLLTERRLRQRDDAKKFRSWVVGLKVGKETGDFLDRWMHHSIKTDHKFSDQIALYKTWKDFSVSSDDVVDYKEFSLSACHFGGYKFGSKFQGTARGSFRKGHSGAMKAIRKLTSKQPRF